MLLDFDRLKEALAGRYTLERELGQGGMAVVYLAVDSKHSRRVALKVLLPELAATVGPKRFLREIEIAAGLNHPHVLPLHDSGEVDGFLYYVMPFVEGESLRDRLDRDERLPLDEALRIARDVAEGLDYAHSRGVVHRDIKPANILLSEGQRPYRGLRGRQGSEQRERGQDDVHGAHCGIHLIHESGAGGGREAHRRPERSLLARVRGLRDALRRTAVRRRIVQSRVDQPREQNAGFPHEQGGEGTKGGGGCSARAHGEGPRQSMAGGGGHSSIRWPAS